ncbi:twin-arginine translocase TatA/TatE family subunit [Candidatus Bathyarchaeota archaeon]|nr:twin-arginine translocase TatA/TatE family subunit [Candidatus Bathyarchaeota archaeon]
MPLIGWQELILILVILIFLFGATRLKGLAKALGESIREFKKATSESPKSRKEEEDEAIIEAARKMGIDTEGKSVEQILSDMNKRAAKKD